MLLRLSGEILGKIALWRKRKKLSSRGCTVQIKCVHPPHVLLLLLLHLLFLLRLSRSDPVQGAGLAGGRAGREEGPHPRELRGDAVAAAATDTADDGNIY